MSNGEAGGSSTTQGGDDFLGWQIFSQSIVVILGLAAVVVSLALILDAYEVEEAASTVAATTAAQQSGGASGSSGQSGAQSGGGSQSSSGNSTGSTVPTGPGGGSPTETAPVASAPESTSVSSSSVVAILTPIMAGIVGIAGLFFGVSATGSARGRQAGTTQTVADVSTRAMDLATEVRQEEKTAPSPQGTTEPRKGDDGF